MAELNGEPSCEDPTCKKVIAIDPVVITDAQGLEHHFHQLCFWKARAVGFEQMYNSTHQALCAVLCSRALGGRCHVSKRAQTEAAELEYKLVITNLPDQGLELKMINKRVTLA